MVGSSSRNDKIRQATPKDKLRVVELLSAAFEENLSVNFVIKNDGKRKYRVKNLMDYSFEIGMRFGKVFVSDDLNSACILLFPEKKNRKISTLLMDITLAFSVIGIKNIRKVLQREYLVKQSHPKDPFIHLWYIGVDPEFQNRGFGSRMMHTILRDHAKPIYLETSTSSNIPFYKKHGFHVEDKINLGYELFCLNNNG